MRHAMKGIMILLLVVLVAGCTLTEGQVIEINDEMNETNETNDGNETKDGNEDNEINEDDLSPIQEEPEHKVSKEIALYYADSELMTMYRVQSEVEADQEEDLPLAALKLWMNGPEQEGLGNLMPPEVVVETIEFNEGIAHISFSQEIRNANLGSSGEMFLIEQITLLMKQFGYDATQLYVEGEIEDSILGHVTTSEPIDAPSLDEYDWYE